MMIETLFQEKIRLLNAFLEETKDFQTKFKDESVTLEDKISLIDQLTDLREANVKTQMALDEKIDTERRSLSSPSIEKLQGDPAFKKTLDEVLRLIKEIQLTDQSLFLYIQSMGSEVRSQILKSLKEKEAMSKFKSQSQSPTGDEVDRIV